MVPEIIDEIISDFKMFHFGNGLGIITFKLYRNKVKTLNLSVHSHRQWKSLSGIERYCRGNL